MTTEGNVACEEAAEQATAETEASTPSVVDQGLSWRTHRDTYPDELKALAAQFASQARLVQSAVSGLYHVPPNLLKRHIGEVETLLDRLLVEFVTYQEEWMDGQAGEV